MPIESLPLSPMPDIPNFLSYAYHLSNCPCPTANIGRLPTNRDFCLLNCKDSNRIGIIDSGRCPILCPFTYRMGLTKYIETCRWQEEVACGIRWPGRVRGDLDAIPKMRGIYPIICSVGCRCVREPGDFCTLFNPHSTFVKMVPLTPQQIGIPAGVSSLNIPHGLVYIRAVFTQITCLRGIYVCGRIVFVSKAICIRYRCIPLTIERTAVICWGEIGCNVCNGVDSECRTDSLADKSLDFGRRVFKIAINFQGVCAGSNHQVGTVTSDVGCGIVQPKTGICACTLCGVGDSLCSATLRHKSCACEIVSAGNIIVGCNNNPGKIRHRTGGRAMKNETRCTENKLPSVRSTNNTGCPSGIGQPV